MDPYRLPRQVVPTRYEIRLEPDLATAAFTGVERVAVSVTAPTSVIVLNAVELSLESAALENARGDRLAATIRMDEAAERCHLGLPRPVTPGDWHLHLTFRGTLNDKLRGFYRSTFKDPATGLTRTLAATQFEATDARRAFPCWDEPDFKAVFACTLVVDPHLTAISNTRVVAERMEGGKKVVQFADTIPMSTYLVAFVVGELESSEPVHVGATPLRVWCVPGKRHLTGFGREIAAASLRFFERYYDLPYPGDKLDLLAIPDFAAGAMENLGAITFRETALLVDERQATHAELERVADVVAHENAHMWFGDLVTMSWWNGIWLNEAFATFMEMLAVDDWKPEWKRWTTFGVSRAAAFATDALWSTRPIEYEVRAPRDADAMFDVLTYEKGASVLRMVEQYLGPEVFRQGVRDYLRTHAYGNADTGDLWAALGRAAGQSLDAMMRGWIFTPGFPLISARREGAELVLSQRRFTYLPEPPPFVRATGPGDVRWQVPIRVRIDDEVRTLRLDGAETRLPLPPGARTVLVNESGPGFYRVHYAPELLAPLLGGLPGALEPIERFNLVSDAWATTLAGLTRVADYLALLPHFHAERDRNVWTIILTSLHALNRVIAPEDRHGLEAYTRALLAPAVSELGWDPRAGEDELTRQLRGDLLRALGTLGNDPAVQARAAERYAAALADPTAVDPNVLPALIAVLAHAGDERRYEEFLQRFRAARTPQEEQRYLYALAGFQPRPLLDQTLERTINGEIRTQDAPFVARALLMSVYGREAAWAFVKANWDRMERLFPKHGLRRMCEGVTALATPELEADVHAFFAARRVDFGGKTLEQYLEHLRVAVALREREAATLGATLKRFA
ncbi:MAG TPA: M1 family metallopeptidase [Candidatus Binatia bacterium]|nr:M1 family metallopeptidase [Candidatus Binatia bacterium]